MRTWAVAQGVAWRYLHNFLTNRSIALPSLAFPLFFFAAFAGGLSSVEDVPGFDYAPGYTGFQFVFVLLQTAALAGVFTGFTIARDFESGFARRLLLASPNRLGILLGYALAALARWAIVAVVLTVAALAVGMQVGGGAVDLFGLYALALLVDLVGLLWAAGVAMRMRTIQSAPIMNLPVFMALFLAPVYVPLDLLADWIHAIALVNPATAFLETGRGFLAGEEVHVALAFGLALALVAAFAVWAVRGLRKAEAAG